MSKLKLLGLALVFGLANMTAVFGQGCSDAGFCTMDSFKPDGTDSVAAQQHQLKVGAFVGGADYDILVYGNYLEYNRQLNEKLGLDFKITTLGQSGNGIAVFGVSDVFVTANYRATESLKLTLGTKIPLGRGNTTLNNLPLPLDYHASLGTFDLIFGVGYAFRNLQVVAAIQQPLTQNNNQFLASAYPVDNALYQFQSTRNFVRRGDVLLRLTFPFDIGHKLRLSPSLLPIYHLANDKYTDALNVEREILGSRGLTLNGNIYLDYEVNTKSSLQLNLAMPFVVRTARPDGLTRSFIANLEYRIRF